MPNGNEMSLMTHMVLTGGQTFARLLLFSMPLFDKDFCLNNVQNNVFFFNLEVGFRLVPVLPVWPFVPKMGVKGPPLHFIFIFF